MIFKNWQTLFTDKTNNRLRAVISASVQKKKTKKDTQMVEHSSYNEDAVMRVEAVK